MICNHSDLARVRALRSRSESVLVASAALIEEYLATILTATVVIIKVAFLLQLAYAACAACESKKQAMFHFCKLTDVSLKWISLQKDFPGAIGSRHDRLYKPDAGSSLQSSRLGLSITDDGATSFSSVRATAKRVAAQENASDVSSNIRCNN